MSIITPTDDNDNIASIFSFRKSQSHQVGGKKLKIHMPTHDDEQ